VRPDDERVEAAAVRFFYENLRRLSLQTLVFPVVTVWVFWPLVNHTTLLIWAAICVVVYLRCFPLTQAYFRTDPPPSDYQRWARYYTWSSIAPGFIWGVAAFLFYVPGNVSSQVFLYVMIIGLAAGAMIAYVNIDWPFSFYAYGGPSFGLAIAALLTHGGAHEATLAVLLTFYFFMMIQMGNRLRNQVYEGIRLQYENADLAQDLERQKNAAEAANRAKTRFLASANHDLRQPIHAMSMLVYALKNEVNTDQGRSIHNQLTLASGHLNELLKSLLDLSRLDAQAIDPQQSTFELQPVLSRLLGESLPIARAKNIGLRVHPTDVTVMSDPILLERMLRNLIHNAVTYTQSGGVLVGVRRLGDGASIEIWDTGVGINREEQHQIFQEFFQAGGAHREQTSSTQGLGLGLAICQRLADLLGHRLSFCSNPGAGSVFKIRLPITDRSPAAIAPTATQSHADPDLKNALILIVDDDTHSLQAMVSLFRQWNARVLTAESVEQALSYADEDIALIISDFHLGASDNGIDLINQLREQHHQTALPAIIVTGDTSKNKIETLANSGIPVLHKPVLPEKLIRQVEELVKTYRE